MEVFKSGILLEEAQEISFLVRYVCLRQFGVLGSADSPQGARGIFFFFGIVVCLFSFLALMMKFYLTMALSKWEEMCPFGDQILIWLGVQ